VKDVLKREELVSPWTNRDC